MTLKAEIEAALAFIRKGGRPNTILATNNKTEFSCFDNVPHLTCYGMCPVRSKCYDVKTLKLYKNARRARLLRHFFLFTRQAEYVAQLIGELKKKRRKPISTMRIYAGGDFTPAQLPAIQSVVKACPEISFYMISKTIRMFPAHAAELLGNDNFFLCLSEMDGFCFGAEWKALRAHPRVNSVYTLMPHETDFSKACAADIVFNVSKTQASIAKYLAAGLPLCPCDAKTIPSKSACGSCGMCSTKGGVKGNIGRISAMA